MSDDDLPVWDVGALRAFTRHEAPEVRAWAWERLADLRDPALAPVFAEGLAGADEVEREVLLDALVPLAPAGFDEATRALLAAFEAAPATDPHDAREARLVLVRAGDDAALTRVAARCRDGGGHADEWLALCDRDEAAARAILRDGGWLDDPTGAPTEALAVLARLCAPEALARVHERAIADEAHELQTTRAVVERTRADMVPFVGGRTFTKGRAFAELVAARLAARRSAADRALAARWEGADALRAIADAVVSQRWGEAAAWARARLDELRRHDDASHAARAYAAWVARQRKPDEAMVEALVSMALGAVDGALEAFKPFERADPETRARRTLAACAADVAARHAWALGAWEEPVARAALTDAMARACEGDDEKLRARVVALCGRLPDVELPDGFARGAYDADWAEDAVACLVARPASLDRLARAALASAAPDLLVVEALGRCNQRGATATLRGAVARFARGEERISVVVLDAVGELRDPALLPALLDEYEPDHESAMSVARALSRLARVAPEPAWRAPEVLAALAELEALSDDGPAPPPGMFAVGFICAACGAEGQAEAPTCYVRGDRASCLAEGWDGVSFDRVIVCARCGARDRYALTPATLLRAFLSVETGAVEVAIGALEVEGQRARRASELLDRAGAAAAQQDPEALRRLGATQLALGDAAGARETLAASFAGDRRDLAFLVQRHDDLEELVDDALVERSARALMEALPGARGDDALRKRAAEHVASWLRGVGGATVTWRLSEGELTDSVALARVTRWDRFVALLHEPSVTALAPCHAPPASAGRLERAIEGTLPLSIELQPRMPRAEVKAMTELARRFQAAGRNDPCPCGSGKKYKKCHLAER